MIIDRVIEDLKEDEGWRPTVYRDSLGIQTLGYGFNVDADHGGDMPKAVGEFWLKTVAEQKQEQLSAALPWLHNQPEGVQRGLLNMAYQLGVDGVLGFPVMLSRLKSGDREGAYEAALDSKWARQTPKRANKVASIIRGTA